MSSASVRPGCTGREGGGEGAARLSCLRQQSVADRALIALSSGLRQGPARCGGRSQGPGQEPGGRRCQAAHHPLPRLQGTARPRWVLDSLWRQLSSNGLAVLLGGAGVDGPVVTMCLQPS